MTRPSNAREAPVAEGSRSARRHTTRSTCSASTSSGFNPPRILGRAGHGDVVEGHGYIDQPRMSSWFDTTRRCRCRGCRLPAKEHVVEAVPELAHEDEGCGGSWAVGRTSHLSTCRGRRFQQSVPVRPPVGSVKWDAHEEASNSGVPVLLAVLDVGVGAAKFAVTAATMPGRSGQERAGRAFARSCTGFLASRPRERWQPLPADPVEDPLHEGAARRWCRRAA